MINIKTQLDLKEINNIPKNGYNVVSLFSGCGGSSLGYKLAGYDVKLAVEFIPNAIEVYKLNHPNTIVLDKDIRDIKGEDILNLINMKKGELDILDGSPPCSAFSSVGAKDKNWGKVVKYSDTKQRVDDLFLEYVRIVNELLPKVIVAENVKGLTESKAKFFLEEVMEKLGENYNVEYKVLKAKDYEVPQNRPRTIIIGVRKDLGITPSYPLPIENQITVGEAFRDLKQDDEQKQYLFDMMDKYTRVKDVVLKLPKNPEKSIDGTYAFNGQRKFFSLIRISNSKVANTIVVKGGDVSLGCGLIHPNEDRKLTIPELKRLQTIPDDFILVGEYKRQYERIARSVPPTMMKYISLHIKENILDKIHN